MNFPGRMKPIIKKEFRQISRDPRTLAVLVFFPVLLLVLFGYALNFDVKHIGMAVYDEDKSPQSREFVDTFFHSEYFDQAYYLRSKDEVNSLLDEGKVAAVLVVPYDFSRKLIRGEEASVQILVDGSNANKASTVLGYATGLVQSYSLKIISQAFMRKAGRELVMPIDVRPRVWYNPELKSAKFLVPGLIAFILMISCVISTSMAIVKEKERNTMEQIIVSPVKPLELIIGKTIPYILISLVTAYLILLMGWLLFDVAVKGSQLQLFFITVLYLFVALGTGLLISTVANTQQLAFQLSLLLTMLPTMILSGFIFPIRNMPEAVQLFTYLIPARYFLVAMRGIILKGAGIGAFWPQVLYMAVFAFALTGLSWVRMRKKRL